jgi:glycosyltransferase involved in cell wall biosynthesis
MTNLFRDWPSENIAVITDKIAETNPQTTYLYYQLGSEEIKLPFPFNFFETYSHSGQYHFYSGKTMADSVNKRKNIFFMLKKNVRPFIENILNLTGLISVFYRINLSESLKKWIVDFSPDIVYVQPFHHQTMQFANLLYSYFSIPYAIHVMDDSVKYINRSVFFKRFLQKKIECDFKRLISNAKVLMCISEAMSSEYLARYGKVFFPFRNPIDVDQWLVYQRKSNNIISEGSLRIIYTGRLFSPTFFSLLDVCCTVDRLNRRSKAVDLHIYTHDKNPAFFDSIKGLLGVSICKPVEINEIPAIIQQYDIFLLCLDFDRESQNYSQYSISTRTSEGMISAVPVLVYAPRNSALFKYFTKNDSGCMIGDRDSEQLESAIIKLWNDTGYRDRIVTNAVRTALSDSNSVVIREEFRKALSSYRNA